MEVLIILSSDESDSETVAASKPDPPSKNINVKVEKCSDASPAIDSMPGGGKKSSANVQMSSFLRKLNETSPVRDPIPRSGKKLDDTSPAVDQMSSFIKELNKTSQALKPEPISSKKLNDTSPTIVSIPVSSKKHSLPDQTEFKNKEDKYKYPKLSCSQSSIKGAGDTKKEEQSKDDVYKFPTPTKDPDDTSDCDWKPNNCSKKKNEWASLKSPPIYNFENKLARLCQIKNRSQVTKCPRLNLATKLDFANEASPAKVADRGVTSTSSPSYGGQYEVEKIVDQRELGPERFLYLVKWRGFDDTLSTWEPLENLTECVELVYEYKLKAQTKQSSPVYRRYLKLKSYLSQHTDQLLDVFLQRFCNDRGELVIPKVDVREINSHIQNFARHPQLVKTNSAELNYLREQLLTSILYQKRLGQLEILKSYETEINVTAGNMVAPIYVINNVDLSVVPTNFHYTNLNIPTEGVVVNEEPIIWCECADNCRGSTSCCGQLNDSVSAYDSSKHLTIKQGTPIYECNKNCKCNASCPNRVIQLGTQVKLAIYKTYNGCGWGVQTLEFIPRGTYVTEYVGEILTYVSASRRENQTYLFNLDFNGSTAYVIDACNYGNISHFINHSCEPNLAVFPAYIQCVDPNLHRLPLFAIKDIEKGDQLSFSYYKSVGKTSSRKVKCKCDAASCRGFLSVEGSSL